MPLDITIIAVCEDDETMLKLIRDIFQDNGIYALYYSGPFDLLEGIKNGVSLILADHYYEGIKYNGLTLTKRIKQMYPDCRIIIVSITRNPSILTEYANSGLVDKILYKLEPDFKFQLIYEVKKILKELQPDVEETVPTKGFTKEEKQTIKKGFKGMLKRAFLAFLKLFT